uniref:COMM domain-containing protein n=1 Tax=Steinernema glaseri TaxID=37863 RepID=A0A1I7Y104_9BILA
MASGCQSLQDKALIRLALQFEERSLCPKLFEQISKLPNPLCKRLECLVNSMSAFRAQFRDVFDLQANINKIILDPIEVDVNETLKGAPNANALVIAIRNKLLIKPKEIFDLLSPTEKRKFKLMAEIDKILWINLQLIQGRTFREDCPELRQFILISARAGCDFTVIQLLYRHTKNLTIEGVQRLLDLVKDWCDDSIYDSFTHLIDSFRCDICEE